MTQERVKITNAGLIAMSKVIRAWEGLNDNVIPPGVNNFVQPITDADRMLESTALLEAQIDLTGTAGDFVPLFTVPAGKRRVLLFAGRGGTTASSTMNISDGANDLTISGGGTVSEKLNGLNYPLDVGWAYGMGATGNPADSAVFCTAIFIETDAFES